MSRYIYRYKYLSDGKGIRSVISERKIRFTNPQNFNDPFDCAPFCEAKFGRLKEDIDPTVFEVLQLKGLPVEQVAMRVESAERAMAESFASGQFLKDLLNGASVLSLSKIPDSILMWSHYGKDHTGAVVEFKINIGNGSFDVESSHDDLICLDVQYAKERPVVTFDGGRSVESKLIDNLILTKAEEWAYEQESRVLKSKGGAGNFDFKHELLSSVILGARSKSSVELRGLVAQAERDLKREIPVYQAELCKRNYVIEIPGFHYRTDAGRIQSANPVYE